MFKDIYKSANNDIKADEELLQKVLAMAGKKNSRPKTVNFYRYVSIAAAVLIITVSAVILSDINSNNKEYVKNHDNTNDAIITEKENEKKSSAIKKDVEDEETVLKRDTYVYNSKPENKASETLKKEKVETDAPAIAGKVQIPSDSSAPKKEQAGEINNNSTEEVEKTNNDDEASLDTAENAPEKGVTVVWNINDISQNKKYSVARTYGIAPSTFSGGEASEEASYEEPVYETWTKKQYVDYLGFDVENTVSVPSDMSLYPTDNFSIVKNSSDGTITEDFNSYFYEADYSRFITVTTTKNTDEYAQYLDKEAYSLSTVGNEDVSIIYDGNIYNAYMTKKSVGISVTAGGVTQEELQNTIISIMERK